MVAHQHFYRVGLAIVKQSNGNASGNDRPRYGICPPKCRVLAHPCQSYQPLAMVSPYQDPMIRCAIDGGGGSRISPLATLARSSSRLNQ